MTEEAYEKFERDFETRRSTLRTCSKCGKDRQYGHGCTHCGAMIMDLLEFGDAMKISFEAMTPEQKAKFQQDCRDDRLRKMPCPDGIQ